MATSPRQRSVPEVLQDIVGNLQEIIRSEFLLAKTELKEEAKRAAKPATTFGVGLVFGIYGMGFLLLGVLYALALVMPVWLAGLLVGTSLAIVALALMSSSGKKLKHISPTPHKTIQSLEENVQWATRQIK
jgi:uncharacterized membrane protein YqjE